MVSELGVLPRSAAIVGWRYWRVHPAARLGSISQRGFWWAPDQPLVARCVGGPGEAEGGHSAPDADCSCGIYASAALISLQDQALCLRPVPLAVGQVQLWGRVACEERADHGVDHRGQFAAPSRLWVITETLPGGSVDAAVENLAAAYGVAVDTMALEKAVGEASRTVLANLTLSARTSAAPSGGPSTHRR